MHKMFLKIIIVSSVALSVTGCSGVVNYFDELGKKMPTYDKVFGDGNQQQ